MSIKRIEKQLDRELKEVEAWILARRKFFIKLAWVLGFLAVVIILSNIYLKLA